MRELALFAGVGGGILGGKLLGWQTVCAVEIDEYRQRVLMQRQDDGALEPFPIWGDVRTFDGRPWAGLVDVITAGFPCQPFARSGKQQADGDERNGWPDTARIIRQVRPRFALLENSADLPLFDYFGTILGDLAEGGMGIRWECIPAAAVGAPHGRHRWWGLAYAEGERLEGQRRSVEDCRAHLRSNTPASHCAGLWRHSVRDALRMDDGLPKRVDRISACGDAQVPICAAMAYLALGGPLT